MSPAKRSKKAKAAPPPPGPVAAVLNKPGVERKATLGGKHECFACSAKFYDMNKPEPICPRCGADQRKRPRTPARKPPVAPPPPPKPAARAAVSITTLDEDPDDEDGDDEEYLDEDMELDLESIGGSDGDDLSELSETAEAIDEDERD